MSKKLEVKTGDKYGYLTVIKEVEPHIQPSGQKQRTFLCQCDCGSDPVKVVLSNLKRGRVKSCGCVRKEKVKERSKKYNIYDLTSEEYGIGYTLKGEEFYFDLEDYNLIKDYCWRFSDEGYVITREADTNKIIKMHRLVTNCPDNMVVDHINHEKNNNKKENLRICTQAENMKNLSIYKNNTSGVTGVYFHKASNKWRAVINVKGKKIFLGAYRALEEAEKSRLEAEEKYFGGLSPNSDKFKNEEE